MFVYAIRHDIAVPRPLALFDGGVSKEMLEFGEVGVRRNPF